MIKSIMMLTVSGNFLHTILYIIAMHVSHQQAWCKQAYHFVIHFIHIKSMLYMYVYHALSCLLYTYGEQNTYISSHFKSFTHLPCLSFTNITFINAMHVLNHEVWLYGYNISWKWCPLEIRVMGPDSCSGPYPVSYFISTLRNLGLFTVGDKTFPDISFYTKCTYILYLYYCVNPKSLYLL